MIKFLFLIGAVGMIAIYGGDLDRVRMGNDINYHSDQHRPYSLHLNPSKPSDTESSGYKLIPVLTFSLLQYNLSNDFFHYAFLGLTLWSLTILWLNRIDSPNWITFGLSWIFLYSLLFLLWMNLLPVSPVKTAFTCISTTSFAALPIVQVDKLPIPFACTALALIDMFYMMF